MLVHNKLYPSILVAKSENLHQIGWLVNIQKIMISKLIGTILQVNITFRRYIFQKSLEPYYNKIQWP